LVRGSRCSSKETVLVLDTSALLTRYPLHQYSYRLYTTPSVLEEVRDSTSREGLELSLAVGRLAVVEPSRVYKRMVVEKAREIGEHTSLSETDVDVASLALQLSRDYNVIVLTDDYSLQNTLYHLGISFKPIKTTGIKKARRYRVYCRVCGYVPSSIGEENCPFCGSRLVKSSS